MPNPWQFIPTSVMAATARQGQAATWAAAQRSQLAAMWADNQRQQVQSAFGGAQATSAIGPAIPLTGPAIPPSGGGGSGPPPPTPSPSLLAPAGAGYQTPGPTTPMLGSSTQKIASLGGTATSTVGQKLYPEATRHAQVFGPPQKGVALPTLGVNEQAQTAGLAGFDKYQPTTPMPFLPDPNDPLIKLEGDVARTVGQGVLGTVAAPSYAITGALSEFGKQRQSTLNLTPMERLQQFPSAIAATAKAAGENVIQGYGGEPIGGSTSLGEWGMKPGLVRDALGLAIELAAPVPGIGEIKPIIKGGEQLVKGALRGAEKLAASDFGKVVGKGLVHGEEGVLRLPIGRVLATLPDPDAIGPAVTAIGRSTREAPNLVPPMYTGIKKVEQDLARLLFNRNTDLAEMERLADASKKASMTPAQRAALGNRSSLTSQEQGALLNRLNSDMAAKVKVDEGLRPILKDFQNPRDLELLSRYVIAQDNIDKAAAIGRRVTEEAATTGGVPSRPILARTTPGVQPVTSWTAATQEAAIAQGIPERRVRDLLNGIDQPTDEEARILADALGQGRAAESSRAFSGGIDVLGSKRVLNEMRTTLAPDQMAKVENAASRLWAFGDSLLQQRVDAGIVSTADALDLRARFTHYVPDRILAYLDEATAVAPGKRLGLSNSGIKTLTEAGTFKAREDPIYSLVESAYKTQAAVNKNNVFNAFLRMREYLPEYKAVIRDAGADYKPQFGETLFSGFVDGEVKHLVVPKEWETLVLRSTTPYIKGLSEVMSVYRSLLTSRNPFFLARNLMLDAYTFTTREYARAGANPLMMPRILKALGEGYFESFSGIMTNTYKGEAASALKSGMGMFGFAPGAAMQAGKNAGKVRAQTVRELTQQGVFEIKDASDVQRIIKDILTLQPVESVGARIELAPRVASYKLAKARGESELEAVIAGRTVTIDFDQGGTLTKSLNQIVPFFNVNVQALAQPYRTFKENPRGAIGSAIVMLATPTILAEAWNRADPQRSREYDDVPDYIKQMGIVLMLPGVSFIDEYGNKRPAYLLLRTREFTPIVSVTRQIASGVLGGNTQSASELLKEIIGGISPISGQNFGALTGQVLPPVLSTGVELGTNRDLFRGRYIATNYSDQNASALSKALTSGVNAAGNAVGWNPDFRPSQIEYAIRDITGGPGGAVLGASNIVAGENPLASPKPLWQQMAGPFVGQSIGQNLQTAQDKAMSPAMLKGFQQGGVSYRVGPVSNTIGTLRLTIDEQTIYQEAVNRAADKAFQALFADPLWKNATPEERTVYAQSVMDSVRNQSKMVIPSLQSMSTPTTQTTTTPRWITGVNP